MGNKIINKIKQWWDVGTINPERDEAKMPVLLLWVERAAIMVVAVVSGIAVAVFGYMKAADYTSLEIIRWLSAGLMFFLATAITDVGVKYFIQKSAFDLFAAFNPKTYKDSKANWQDLVIIVVACILTFACFHYCELNEFINNIATNGINKSENPIEYSNTIASPLCIISKFIIKVLLFCLFISIAEVVIKSFLDYNPIGRYSWFQRAMQVVAWVCMIVIVAGLFWFDYVSVDSVRRPVANLVKKETKLNQDSIRRAVDAQEQARIDVTITAIKGLEIEVKKTAQKIEQERRRIASGYDKGIQLYESRNAWFFDKKLNKAFANSDRLKALNKQLEKLESNKQALTDQQTADITYRSNIIAKTDSSVLAENAAIDGRNTSLVEGTSSLFIWMGFYAKCIAGIIRILLVVMFMGGNVKDYNGDGKIDHTDVNSAAYVGFQPG